MLAAVSLTALRGDRVVLQGLNLRLAPGGAAVLRGANGSGKSTLLRILAGLRRPDGGTVRWNGADIRDDRDAHAARVGYLGHHDAIKPGLTVAGNVTLGLDGPDPLPALDRVGLAGLAAQPGRVLSAGQRRRVALARLCHRARPCWLLDEPTLGLDDAALALLGALLAGHRASGGLVVAATHVALPLPDARTHAL